MKDLLKYFKFKLLVLIITFIVLSGSILLPDPFWSLKYLVIAYIIIGYSHFIVGYIYQHKSLRKKNSNKNILIKVLLPTLILSLLAFTILTDPQFYLYFFIFIIIYFLLHGYFNDKTIFKKITGEKIPFNHFLINLLLLSFFFKSLTHETVVVSIEMTRELFSSMSATTAYLPSFFEMLFPITLTITIFFYGIYLALGRKKKSLNEKIITYSFPLVAILTIIIPQISFIYLLSFILVYHFLEWALFSYLQIKKGNKKELKKYYAITILSILPFTLALVPFIFLTPGSYLRNLSLFILSTNLYLVATFFHITSSFFNESWIKNKIGLK